MSNKVRKTVSFNVTNPDEKIMLDAIKRRNFSGYVKKLIKDDLEQKGKMKEKKKKEPKTPAQKEETKQEKELTFREKLQLAKQKQNAETTKPFINNKPKN